MLTAWFKVSGADGLAYRDDGPFNHQCTPTGLSVSSTVSKTSLNTAFFNNSSFTFSENPAANLPVFGGGCFSIALWVYQDTSAAGVRYIMSAIFGSTYRAQIFMSGTTLFFGAQNGVTLSTSLTTNEWTHIIGTYDVTTGTYTLYKNGVQASQSSVTAITEQATTIYVGSGNSGANTFHGYLNDIRFYNHCLSALEIDEVSSTKFIHFNFEKDTDGGADSSEFNNNALVVGTSPILINQGSKIGQGMLNATAAGSGNYLYTTSLSPGKVTTYGDIPHSHVALIKLTSLPALNSEYCIANLYASGTGSKNSRLCIRQRSAGVYCVILYTFTDDTYNGRADYAFATDTWYHIVVTLTLGGGLSKYKIYVNGQSLTVGGQGSADLTFEPPLSLYLGQKDAGPTDVFQGYIDDYRLYLSDLLPTYIAELYARASTRVAQLTKDGEFIASSFKEDATVDSVQMDGTASGDNANGVTAGLFDEIGFTDNLIQWISFRDDLADHSPKYLGTHSYKVVVGSLGTNEYIVTSGKYDEQGALYLKSQAVASYVTDLSGVFPYDSGYNEFTISAWVNPAAVPQWTGTPTSILFISTITGVHYRKGAINLAIHNDGVIEFGVYDNPAETHIVNASSAAGILPMSTWTHITATFKYVSSPSPAVTAVIYVNGFPTSLTLLGGATSPKAIPSVTRPIVYVGYGVSHAYRGYIADLRTYDKALTAQEAAALYYGTLNPAVMMTNITDSGTTHILKVRKLLEV
jgi:hypothetical protein